MTTLLFATFLFAYIPGTDMILDRTVKNAPGRPYRITQTVRFQNETGDTFTVREVWTIVDSNQIYLTASSSLTQTPEESQNTFSYQAVYESGQRFLRDSTGQLQRTGLTSDFYHRLLLTRSRTTLSNHLSEEGIVPKIEEPPAPPETIEEIQHESPRWIRLSRQNGFITYKLSLEQTPPHPAIWISQDVFFVTKLRLSSGLVVDRFKPETYQSGMKWPSRSEISWGENRILVNIEKVESVRASSLDRDQLRNPQPVQLNIDGPLSAVAREFYSRTR